MRRFIILSIVTAALMCGCDNKSLERIERKLTEAECRELGHDWKFDSSPIFSTMFSTAVYIVVDDGNIIEEERDGPWYFKCERCGERELISTHQLTQDMRYEIRKRTGCWPKKRDRQAKPVEPDKSEVGS